ncbi:MAG: type IV secretion system DNA-binding domain-containing protein [bacterium]
MDMGTFNQDMFKNSYSKNSQPKEKKEKKRGIIDMISIAQMKYASEKNGVPLPSDVITTGHMWDFTSDIMFTGSMDILITFFLISIGISFLILSGDLYNFHHFSVLNYIIGGFIFAIPGSYYSLMLTSTIMRFYEINLINTQKIIKLIFNSLLTIQIMKIFILPFIFYGIFYAFSTNSWLIHHCKNKMKFAINHHLPASSFFLWDHIFKVLSDYKYRTITNILIDLSIGLILILLPPIIALKYKTKKTKNIKNTSVVRGGTIDQRKDKNIIHDEKWDIRGTMISGINGSGKSNFINKIIQSRMNSKNSNKFIFYDLSGEYMAGYYRPGDIIIDITDQRCFLWNFLEEAFTPAITKQITNNIIPEDPKAHDNRFFSQAARRTLADAFAVSKRTGKTDNLSAKRQMLYQSKESFEEIKALTGNVSVSFTDVYQTYANYIDGLLTINNTGDPFNMANWLLNPDDKRHIFINYHMDTLDMQKPVLNLFTILLSNKILNQNYHNSSRINIFIDEFSNIGLINNMAETLSLCRKKNIAFFLATQNPQEVLRIYGEAFWNLIGNINNYYAFRSNDPKSSQIIADLFGKIEKKELAANTAVSTAFKQEHTTTYSTSIRETYMVLPGELGNIPDMTYYAKFLTDDGVAFIKSKQDYMDLPVINSAVYIPTLRDYNAEVKTMVNEILSELTEKEDEVKSIKAEGKKKTEAAVTKKDIKEALKKVKKLADVEKKENLDDNNAD